MGRGVGKGGHVDRGWMILAGGGMHYSECIVANVT